MYPSMVFNRMALRVAARIVRSYEFSSQEALDEYMKEHPDADPEKHWVLDSRLEGLPSVNEIPKPTNLPTVEGLDPEDPDAKVIQNFAHEVPSGPPTAEAASAATRSVIKIMMSKDLSDDDMKKLSEVFEWIQAADKKDEKDKLDYDVEIDIENVAPKYKNALKKYKVTDDEAKDLASRLASEEARAKDFLESAKESFVQLKQEDLFDKIMEKADKAKGKYQKDFDKWVEDGMEGDAPKHPKVADIYLDDVPDELTKLIVEASAPMIFSSNKLKVIARAIEGTPLEKKLDKASEYELMRIVGALQKARVN